MFCASCGMERHFSFGCGYGPKPLWGSAFSHSLNAFLILSIIFIFVFASLTPGYGGFKSYCVNNQTRTIPVTVLRYLAVFRKFDPGSLPAAYTKKPSISPSVNLWSNFSLSYSCLTTSHLGLGSCRMCSRRSDGVRVICSGFHLPKFEEDRQLLHPKSVCYLLLPRRRKNCEHTEPRLFSFSRRGLRVPPALLAWFLAQRF